MGEVFKELEKDNGDASEPKDGDATVVTSEGKKSKASKKVSLKHQLAISIQWCFMYRVTGTFGEVKIILLNYVGKFMFWQKLGGVNFW